MLNVITKNLWRERITSVFHWVFLAKYLPGFLRSIIPISSDHTRKDEGRSIQSSTRSANGLTERRVIPPPHPRARTVGHALFFLHYQPACERVIRGGQNWTYHMRPWCGVYCFAYFLPLALDTAKWVTQRPGKVVTIHSKRSRTRSTPLG